MTKKQLIAAEWLAAQVEESPGKLLAFVGPRREYFIDEVVPILRLKAATKNPIVGFNASSNALLYKDGTAVKFFGSTQPARLRGCLLSAAWVTGCSVEMSEVVYMAMREEVNLLETL